MIKLGDKAKDQITGFEGVWFDEQRLDSESEVETGGPGPCPPSREYKE